MTNVKSITIFGNKQVGKTALFRKLVKNFSLLPSEKISSVDPLINYTEANILLNNNFYSLRDTPTFFIKEDKETLQEEIKERTKELLETSTLIIWLIDINKEVNNELFLTSKWLKKIKVPIILTLNKIDLLEKEEKSLDPFRILKQKNFCLISVAKGLNLEKLVEKIVFLAPAPFNNDKLITIDKRSNENKLNLVIFGPPNSGKSTLLNCLLKKNRSLTSSIPGTTQEPVISDWKWQDFTFQLVDTAGITKEGRKKEHGSLQKADLTWVVIDATVALNKQIFQIIHLAEKYQKPLIIIVNKRDLVQDKKTLDKEIRDRLKSLAFCPIVNVSALKETGIKGLLLTLKKMLIESKKQLNKKGLEKAIENLLVKNPPPYHKKGKLKIYFAKHEKGLTHRFILFVNNPHFIHFSYQRYIVNCLRKSLNLEYLPVKIILKKST